MPGTTMPCYSGPAGTEGVGACKAGVQQCAADGTGYGPCTGEVVPAPETCLDFIDTLWTARGGFFGHWEDTHLDCEYTYYALLALGHLSL